MYQLVILNQHAFLLVISEVELTDMGILMYRDIAAAI